MKTCPVEQGRWAFTEAETKNISTIRVYQLDEQWKPEDDVCIFLCEERDSTVAGYE